MSTKAFSDTSHALSRKKSRVKQSLLDETLQDCGTSEEEEEMPSNADFEMNQPLTKQTVNCILLLAQFMLLKCLT